MTKCCTKCSEVKPISEFYKVHKDGSKTQSWCKACDAKKKRARYVAKAEEICRAEKDRYARDKETILERNADNYRRNKDKYATRRREYNIQYCAENRDKRNLISANRRASELNATPVWLSPDHRIEMQEFYVRTATLSQQTGVVHHVDHVHPLKGENFSGLHVPWNMQVLDAKTNKAKGNRPPADESHLFWEGTTK